MSYDTTPLPCDAVSPSNPIIIQCRVNPNNIYEKDKITDADYLAPPFTLAFALKNDSSKMGIKGNNMSLKRKRDGDVHNIITNMQRIGDTRFSKGELRCIGVTYDGVLDANGAKKHPDNVGRLAVIVSGAVTITCNKKDLEGLSVGDMLEWKYEDNKLRHNGLSKEWSSVRIGKAHPPLGLADTSTPYEDLFGPKRPYTEKNKDELTRQLYFLNTIYRGNFVRERFAENVPAKDIVAQQAYVFFASKRKELKHREEWVDLMYRQPDSGFYLGLPEPSSDTSIDWLLHCFGDKTHVGWFHVNDTFDDINWIKDEHKKKLMQIKNGPQPEKGTKEYYAYKVLNNMELTGDDISMIAVDTHYKDIDIDAMKDIAKFIAPLVKDDMRTYVYSHAIDNVIPGSIRTVWINMVTKPRKGILYGLTSFDFFNGIIPDIKSPTVNDQDVAEIFKDYLSKYHGGHGGSRTFGMLLEKSVHANEARVLLCPGMGM